jgi:hypothetical protein
MRKPFLRLPPADSCANKVAGVRHAFTDKANIDAAKRARASRPRPHELLGSEVLDVDVGS